MKPTDNTARMNHGFNASRTAPLLFLAFAAAIAVTPQGAVGQDAGRPKPSVPRIDIRDVPLSNAIKNLARQARINYILDPRVPSSAADRLVTVAWTNMSASE